MTEIMIYIVASDAYGNAMAPLPVTTIYPTYGNGEQDTKTLSEAFDEIEKLKTKVEALENSKTTTQSKTDIQTLFEKSNKTRLEMKYKAGDIVFKRESADIAIIEDKLCFKFDNVSYMLQIQIKKSDFEIKEQNDTSYYGQQPDKSYMVKIEDLGNPGQFVMIWANTRKQLEILIQKIK